MVVFLGCPAMTEAANLAQRGGYLARGPMAACLELRHDDGRRSGDGDGRARARRNRARQCGGNRRRGGAGDSQERGARVMRAEDGHESTGEDAHWNKDPVAISLTVL